MKKDFDVESLELHKKHRGKIEIVSKVHVKNTDDLSIAYSPGVAAVCEHIAADPASKRDLVMNGRSVAVISDGSAVLGLGNVGPEAALPVMEGKALLFKEFADIDAIPLVLDTQDTQEIIDTVTALAPSFGGINLEDISAPRCFEIEQTLSKNLDIPVFHDDQHGTAIVVLAGLINALGVTGRVKETTKVVVNGSGAAGVAIVKLLSLYGFSDVTVCDSRGIISEQREDLNETKKKLLSITNSGNIDGSLLEALNNADIFVGVSVANILDEKHIAAMNPDPIIFALANPNPEITPELARECGAAVIATGRSDYPNQINNVLVFPGIFRGALDADKKHITDDMKIAAAEALAGLVEQPASDRVIPGPFDEGVKNVVAKAVSAC